LTFLTCIIVTVLTLVLVSGFTKKTWSAILGTLSGVATAAFFAIIFGKISRLTGLAHEEERMLLGLAVDFNY